MSERTTIKAFSFGDASDGLANHRQQFIDFYHVPSGQSVQFKAFLTAFSDQFSSDWNDEEAFGRMDAISTFKRTKRIISLGWTVPSASIEEAILNQERASMLLSMLYPDYDGLDGGASRIRTGPLFKLRFMNLIQNVASPGSNAKDGGLLGKLNGLSYEPDLEQGFFDSMDPIAEAPYLNYAIPNDARGELIFPQTLKFQCEFTVIHEHSLGWSNKDPRKDFENFPYSSPRANFEGPDRYKKIAPNSDSSLSVEDRNRQRTAQEILSNSSQADRSRRI